MAVEMKVAGIAIHAADHTPVVVLRDLNDRRAIPIWIGKAEASAILHALEGRKMPRPMTHDLLRNVIIECRLSAASVVITDLAENTFYARIELTDQNDDPVSLDARPSDAIALALRLDCPIYVEQKVIDLSASATPNDESSDQGLTPTDDWPELIG